MFSLQQNVEKCPLKQCYRYVQIFFDIYGTHHNGLLFGQYTLTETQTAQWRKSVPLQFISKR